MHRIFSRTAFITILFGSTLLTGCASIVNGTNQVVSVEARHKGTQVVGAQCALVNPKGTFYVTTPGTVTINRAYDDLNVKCEKDGMQPGMAAVKSSTKGMAFGNIIFGGIIGAAVDTSSGAAYDYPTLISVIMGESIVQAPPAQAQSTDTPTTPAATVPVAQK
jgi:hypothetical protein